MLRARHYTELLFLAAFFSQLFYGLNRLGLVFRRYRVNVDEIEARIAGWVEP